MRVRTVALVVLLPACLARAASATTIDTTPADTEIIHFGEPDTTTYGQIITAPADSVLNSFTFFVHALGPNETRFHGYVMAWDAIGFHATGPVLYESGDMGTSSNSLDPFTFTVGSLPLTSGLQYVLFINNSSVLDSLEDGAGFGGRSGDVYAGGEFVFLNSGGDFGPVTVNAWSLWDVPDAAFVAEFSAAAVPEPGAFVSLGAGLAALVVRRRNRKSN